MTRLFAGTPLDRPPRCERCGELEAQCRCAPEVPPRTPPDRQVVRVAVEKRKRGKTVTVVRGLAPEADTLAELLTQLKNLCGAGGTLKEGNLEIQGSHLQRVRDALRDRGYRVQG